MTVSTLRGTIPLCVERVNPAGEIGPRTVERRAVVALDHPQLTCPYPHQRVEEKPPSSWGRGAPIARGRNREYDRPEKGGDLVKRLALIIGVGGVLMLGIASPASAVPLKPPGCFGQAVASLATSEPRAVGNFVTTAIEGLNPPDSSIGKMVPDEKAAVCGEV